MARKCCSPEAPETRESERPSRPAEEPRGSGCGCDESCGCGDPTPSEEVKAA